MVMVRPASRADRDEWLRMRTLLWPDCPRTDHVTDIDDYFSDRPDLATFVAESPDGRLVGFIELSLRSTAEGCNTHPVGYIEGWYVDGDARMAGIGRALVKAGEGWAIGCRCEEMASDTQIDNTTSQLAHEQLGYEEVERVVHFRKAIGSR